VITLAARTTLATSHSRAIFECSRHIDEQFRDQVRDMVQPGTSALFLMLEKVTPDKAVEAMSKYGGTVLKTSLSKDDEKELQDALHGTQADTQ
jgi:uncharacterized membrane protein